MSGRDAKNANERATGALGGPVAEAHWSKTTCAG
jgi:hypothetical protein